MCFKNRNLQNDSKVKTCKECIDEKTVNIISCWIVLFYAVLAVISVSSVLIFNAFYKINTRGIPVGYIISFCLIIAAIIIAFIIFFVAFDSKTKNIKCKEKEIYDDLNANLNFVAWSAVFVVVCLIISAFCHSDDTTKITVYLALLSVTCFIGVRAKSCNNKYALTKIDIDYMPTSDKYSKINGCEEESELLVTKKSYLKYYKEMETNYLMMSAFFVFVTSVLGKFC